MNTYYKNCSAQPWNTLESIMEEGIEHDTNEYCMIWFWDNICYIDFCGFMGYEEDMF